MKFTRSLPAKAMANEKVPKRMMETEDVYTQQMEDFYTNGGDERRVNKQLYGMILHEMSKIAVLHHRRVLETCGHQEEKR